MIQYIASVNEEYSILEQVQMAIEAGCAWVRLNLPDVEYSQLRDIVSELVPMCKENGTILTIDDNLEIAKELSIHGVQINIDKISVLEAREMLGPEAIIGAQVSLPSIAISLKGLDVDYVALPYNLAIDEIDGWVKKAKDAELDMPLVAQGNYGADRCVEILKAGVNGIAITQEICAALDPVVAIADLLSAVSNFQK